MPCNAPHPFRSFLPDIIRHLAMKIIFLLPVALLLTTQLPFAQSVPADFQHTPQLKWKFQTGGPVVGAPVVSDGVIYAGSADSTLYAIDAATGKSRWTFRTGGPIRSGVCLDGDGLFLQGGDGSLYALDKRTGRVRWTFRTQGEKIYPLYAYADYYHASPVYSNGLVYFGSGDGNLYALHAADGTLAWQFQTGDVIHATPAIDGDKLYLASFDGYLYALDASTGALRWKFKSVGHRFFPKGEMQGAPVAAGGLVFDGSRDYNLYAVDAEKGYCHWNKQYPKGWALALAAPDSVLFAGTSDDDVMIAMDPATGQEYWRTNVQFNIFGPAAFSANFLYFGTLQGKLFALDRKTGAIQWTFFTDGYQANRARYFPVEGEVDKNDFYGRVGSPEGYIEALHRLGAVFSTPALSSDLLVFTSTDGGIYCLQKT